MGFVWANCTGWPPGCSVHPFFSEMFSPQLALFSRVCGSIWKGVTADFSLARICKLTLDLPQFLSFGGLILFCSFCFKPPLRTVVAVASSPWPDIIFCEGSGLCWLQDCRKDFGHPQLLPSCLLSMSWMSCDLWEDCSFLLSFLTREYSFRVSNWCRLTLYVRSSTVSSLYFVFLVESGVVCTKGCSRLLSLSHGWDKR